ncbi:ESX secretion-associated protein EspG [Nocardia abscessus]|uniref:ESX secretion-associated protein EspG n=1 Tax=Nocardia abscessus TaxID=120957 RepID=UPI001E62513A
MAEWTWDPDDFAALWYGDAHDRIPGPLRYTSRFAFRDDFDSHRAAVWQRYSADELDEINAAFHTLGASDLRIEILGGTCKHKNSTGPHDVREYRILGARDSYRAVLLSQAGNQHEHGPIRVRMFPAEQLPARLVNAIPPCAPGTERPAMFHPRDLSPSRETYFQDNARNTPPRAVPTPPRPPRRRRRHRRPAHRPLTHPHEAHQSPPVARHLRRRPLHRTPRRPHNRPPHHPHRPDDPLLDLDRPSPPTHGSRPPGNLVASPAEPNPVTRRPTQ